MSKALKEWKHKALCDSLPEISSCHRFVWTQDRQILLDPLTNSGVCRYYKSSAEYSRSMGKKRKVRKGGFPKKEGPREPSGRLQRTPDHGTPELNHRKLSLLRGKSLEITPLGILAGHGLITEAMYRSADQYRSLFFAGHPDNDRPVAPLPWIAKLPSATSDLDEPVKQTDELYLRAPFQRSARQA